MSIDIQHRNVKKTAFPRTGRALDAVGSNTGGSSGGTISGGSSFAGYWTLVTTNAAGEALEEGKEYILSDYTAVSKKDVVAYGVGDGEDFGFPVATASQLGLVGVKSGGGVIVDADGYISIDPSYAGGGSGISQITSSGTGNAVTSLTYDESTKTLTYVKGNTFALASQIPTSLKNPYALSWNGYSTGTYDGSAAKTLSIPNNTNQLTNGAGFIKDGNGNFTTLTGSGSNTKYLAGNGTFYTIAYSELSGTPDLSIYMPKAGGTFTGNVNMNTGSTFPYYRVTNSVGWAQLAGTSGTYLGSALSGIIQSSLAFAIMGRNSSPNMVVFDGGTVKASKDVIAFATSDADDLIAIATTDMYGLVKIDGTTIKVNSSGQIYAAGGGSTVSASASYTSGTSIGAITIDGTKTTFYVPNKVGTSTVGGTARPIYLSSGTPTACSSTVGGTSKPVYMSSGTVTACSATVGSASLPVYMSSGTVTACTASSLFSAMSYSGSTLSITVAGKTRTATISGGSGSWNGGTVTNTIIAPYLWINTTSSSHRLAVNGGALVTGNMQVDSNLFVGTTQSSYKCAIVGNGIITGTWQQNSDMRLKDRIDGVSGVLMAINTLDVFRYTWKDGRDKKYHLGVSAQQIQAIFPELVGSDIYDGYLNVDYTTLGVIVAVQGIKELYRKHTALDNIVRSRQHWELTKDQQIKHLQDTVIRLQKEIEDLKGGVAA
nr:MAG TPA: endosialidase chaperone [Bacteriophage sp.]